MLLLSALAIVNIGLLLYVAETLEFNFADRGIGPMHFEVTVDRSPPAHHTHAKLPPHRCWSLLAPLPDDKRLLACCAARLLGVHGGVV